MDKINKIFKQTYDMRKNIIYFPVRHHSPACAYHVKKAIDLYNPEIILIEGMEDGNSLLEIISCDEIESPFATYHSFVDEKGLVGEKGERYRFYTPFMDSSPELVAIREAKKRNIKALFIDMPMPYHLKKYGEEFHYNIYEKKITFNNKYIKKLCEKENCDNFEELWEKLFELDFKEKSHEEFVKSILAYCVFTREGSEEENEEEKINEIREAYMADNIKKYAKEYKKILVITGGYHTKSLIEIKEEFKKPFDYDEENLKIYPLAYSFDRLSSLREYASGLPYPNYYNDIFCNLNNENTHEQIANEYIVKVIRKLRKINQGISTADGIEALYMAKELIKLRNKKNIGIQELQESILSTFVKGEYTLSSSKPVEILKKELIGNKIGKIPHTSIQPPIITEFHNEVKNLGLDLNNLKNKRVVLDLYRKKSHKKKSTFLHMLDFLKLPFAKLIRSTDILNSESRGTITEEWEMIWSVETERLLLDLSVYGGTLKEVTENILISEVKKNGTVENICYLLKNAYYCGLTNMNVKIFESIKEAIYTDNSFTSQARGCLILHFLHQAASLLEIENKNQIYIYLRETYNKSLYLLSTINSINEDQQESFGDSLNKLYTLSLDEKLNFDKEKYEEIMKIALENIEDSYIKGVIISLLYTGGIKKIREIIILFKSYIYSASFDPNEATDYLMGLFSYGREIIFTNNNFLLELNNLITMIDVEKFYAILPKLRRAFSFYTPLELNNIGGKIAKIYEKNTEEIMLGKAIDERTLELALRLDKIGKKAVEIFLAVEWNKL